MKKEDWEKAKSRLRAPLGQVDLLCDGYSVTLVNVGDELLRKKAEKNYWKNLTANFIAQKPART